MAIGTIYSYPSNPRVAKIQAAANLGGLTLEHGEFAMGQTNKTEEFLSKFPLGKAPTFTSVDGVHLFESNAIAQYVAESGSAKDQLLGTTPAERAQVQQWAQMADSEIAGPLGVCFLHRVAPIPFDAVADQKSIEKVERALGALERHLPGRTWLATEKLSLADITAAASLIWALSFVIDQEARDKYPTAIAWWKRVAESEGVKEAFGEVKFVEKRQTPGQ
ncbi:glutathione S-transferase [Aspergillus karnatakaensis]|uniref:glutathione S-transferase family protein n=1 Tax=Aspergillus karnatakaensis TaxID=1810916 RepID=UPI003CCD5252